MSRGLFKKLKTGGRLGVLNSFGHNKVKKSERRGPPTCTFGQEDEVEEEEVDLFVCVCFTYTWNSQKREWRNVANGGNVEGYLRRRS